MTMSDERLSEHVEGIVKLLAEQRLETETLRTKHIEQLDTLMSNDAVQSHLAMLREVTEIVLEHQSQLDNLRSELSAVASSIGQTSLDYLCRREMQIAAAVIGGQKALGILADKIELEHLRNIAPAEHGKLLEALNNKSPLIAISEHMSDHCETFCEDNDQRPAEHISRTVDKMLFASAKLRQ